MKLRPYRQLFVSASCYNKLSKRFYGPYKILDRIGNVAYRLELPIDSKIHPVFHCSLLKPHHGPLPSSPDILPPSNFNNRPQVEPLSILASKWDTSTSPPTRMVLVQWLGLAPEDTSWEVWEELCSTYHLEDKVILPEVGNDSNQASHSGSNEDSNVGRPKRNIRRPKHLQDFV